MLGDEVFRDSIMRLAARAFFGMGEWSREIVEKFNHEIISVDFSIVGLTGAKKRNLR